MDAPNAASSFNHRYWALKRSQEQASVSSPPPAYSPRRLSTASTPQAPHEICRDSALLLSRSPRTSMLSGCADESDTLPLQEGFSPISLRINTSVVVTKSNNLVCVTSPPTDHANSIAQAVVKTLQENSSGQCGIPMVDEDGRPRPVNIEVDASTMIDGQGNVVGNENVIGEVLRQKQMSRRQNEEVEDDGQGGPAAKRRRPGA